MKYKYYDVTLTCSTKALAVGDILADTVSVGNTSAGFLDHLELFNLSDQDDNIAILFLRSAQSLGTAGSSYTMSDTEVLEVISKVTFTTGAWTDFKDNLWQIKTATHGDQGMGAWLEGATPGTSPLVYIAAVMGSAASTGAYAPAGLKARVGIKHLA